MDLGCDRGLIWCDVVFVKRERERVCVSVLEREKERGRNWLVERKRERENALHNKDNCKT